MKTLIVLGFLLVAFLSSVICEDAIVMTSEKLEQFLRSMPESKKLSYPEVIRAINGKMYYRNPKSLKPQKRIRNIKLNQFVTLGNDRTGNKTSSFVHLTYSDRSKFFVLNGGDGKPGKMLLEAFSQDGACLFGVSEAHTAVKAKACRKDVPEMRWELIPNTFGDYWIKQMGTKLCLVPVLTMSYPTMVQLLPCNKWDPYMIWEIADAMLYYK
ncbi:hypothetical protein Ocin01_11219 [Orchesella cincta]|uniref:Uncharacterized protein n=1 Tax=Orchesella cincta TaxID=48709 RepID=A0A1D2MRE1_ORCCI|nr:hypothetical protein Ocin01_11219 [Orchesella cincta]